MANKKWNKEKKLKFISIILSAALLLAAAFIVHLWSICPKKIIKPPLAIKGKIAIVIDDWGYNLNNLHITDNIKYPLTCAILPNLSYSSRAAEELHNRGFEIILHLPLEPRERYRLEKNTILASMEESTINNILTQDLDNIVYAKGVSNHQGSRATEDKKTMTAVFRELKSRRLYFLDSFVSLSSVGVELGRKMGLKVARRDVFLDNKNEPEYIRGQIYKLKAKAKKSGYAIGIGHDRKNTLLVLAEMMPGIEKEGYRFVFASELAQ